MVVQSLDAQTENSPVQPAPIIFIYDASGSMWGQMQGQTKMEIARDVLSASVNGLSQNQQIGLVAYGHRKKGDCRDVEFMVSMDNSSKSTITSALKKIKPLGKTPLAYSASQVIDQLRTSNAKATIILVTDGIESCDGNICDVVADAKEEGIAFKLHIIGFGLKAEETEQLECAAKAGDGRYFDAADASGLSEVLNEAVGETVDKPRGNVSVYAIKNGQAIDAWVKAYDVLAKRSPMAVRTYKDTAYVYLPESTYNIEVQPLEGSDVDMIVVKGVKSFEDKMVHQTIAFDGGKLEITTTNNGDNWDCLVKLLDESGKAVATVRTYDAPKEVEVNPGTYKVTIQALKMKGMDTYTQLENITIKAGQTTPITVKFATGTTFIDSKVNETSIDSVVSISDINSGTNVAGGRTYDRGREFLLNPGTYSVKVIPLGGYKDRKTQTFTVQVKEGETVTKTVRF
jgi:Ca-activated chloride channel family protein